jgi:chemotaxis protein methyltransferase CheR
LGALADAVGRRFGLSLRDCAPEGIERRLRYRLRDRAFDRVEDYAEYLLYANDATAWDALLETLTTNDSRFLGDSPDFLPLLEFEANPHWARFGGGSSQGGRFRCLSAGSGAGEEAYSLAMALEEVRARRPGFAYEVIGVDLSARALAVARAATYPAPRAASLPAEWRERYLERSGERVRVGSLRTNVRFALANLTAPGTLAPLLAFDVIFARDVLPVLTAEGRRAALANLAASLRPGGILLLGSEESVGDQGLELWPVRWGERHAYVRAHEPLDFPPLEEERTVEPGTALVAHRGAVPRGWLRLLLEGRGYRVAEAADCVGALEISVAGRPRERLFLERTLPSRGGSFVARCLARIHERSPGAVTYIAPAARPPHASEEGTEGRVFPLPLSERDLEPLLNAPAI